MTFDETQHPRDRRRGVRTAGQFVTASRGETGVSLRAGHDVDQRLVDALARYDLSVDDVPPDHEGKTLAQRWAEAVERADGPDVPSLESTLDDMLGNPEYGRHRGGPDLVWTKNGSVVLDDDDDAESVCDLDDERWGTSGWSVAARVHTRNGGGNRECWCSRDDDGHDDGCLKPVIDKLQAHPAYLYDKDDSGDHTYADFYFEVANPDAARSAARRQREHAEQERARSLIRRIEAGPQDADWLADEAAAVPAPWMVMPPNPATAREIAAARERLDASRDGVMSPRAAEALGVRVEYRDSWSGPRRAVVTFTAEHAADVHAMLEWTDDTTQLMPETKARWDGVRRGAMGDCIFYAGRVQEFADHARRTASVREALDAGGMHPDVEHVLREALDSPSSKLSESLYHEAVQALQVSAQRLRELLPGVQAAAEALAVREQDRQLAHLPADARRWPGDWRRTPQPKG